MRNSSPIRIVEAKITEFSKKGNGVGYFTHQNDQQVLIEIPFTIPGDFVSASLLKKRRGIYQGRLEGIIEPSPERIAPRCAHFGVCGGCRWQQVSYEYQLAHKENFVRSVFASLLTSDTDFRPIKACEPPWEYRNKMEFSFSSDSHGRKFLGLVMDSGRGKVFNLMECHLVDTWFADALKAAREWWHQSGIDAYHPYNDAGSLRTLTLREGQRTGDRMVMLTVSGNPDHALHKHHLESFAVHMREAIEPLAANANLSIFLRIQQIAKGMSTNFYEMLLYGPDYIRETLSIQLSPEEPSFDLNFHISPTAFFQPNTRQAEKLYSLALQMAKIPHDKVVYDLYCGTGTLGICVSKHARQVVGIEISPESALDARMNAERNNCHNVKIISGAVRHVLTQIKEENLLPMPDVVMVDPPRPGLDPEAMRQIIDLNPPKILYISCNPITQQENISQFIQHGYRIESMQPVDQFPQTFHIENIAVLIKHLE